MFYLFLCIFIFPNHKTKELEKAYEYLFKGLTSYSAKTVYQSKVSESNSSFQKLITTYDMALKFQKNTKEVLADNQNLNEAIKHAESLLANNNPDETFSASLKKLNKEYTKAKFKNKDLKDIDVLALTNFHTADTKSILELYETYENACKIVQTDEAERRKCEIDQLLNNLPSSNTTFHDVLSTCCEENSKAEKQSKSFIAMHSLASASEILLGSSNVATVVLGSATQNQGMNYYKDPKYINSIYAKSQTVWNSFNPSFLSDPVYLYGNSYTPYQTNAFGESYASITGSNPAQYMSSYYKKQNDTSRDYNNKKNLDLASVKITNKDLETKSNAYASEKVRVKNNSDISNDLLTEDNSDGDYKEVGPEQMNPRIVASKLQEQRASLESKYYKLKDELLTNSLKCQNVGVFSKISCYNKQFEIQGQLYANVESLNTTKNALFDIYAMSSMRYFGFLFLDVFKEAFNLKILYAGATTKNSKKLKIPELIKPFKSELVFDSDWREKMYKLGLKFKKESELAEKKAKNLKKEIRKLLKIKQKDISVAKLANTTELLKEIKNINMLKKQTLVNQKLIQDSIKYNTDVNANNEKLKEAKELSKDFNELSKNLDESLYVDSYYITKDLYDEVPKNTVLREYAGSLIKD